MVDSPYADPDQEYVIVQYKNFNNVGSLVSNYLGPAIGLQKWTLGYTWGNTNTQVVSLGSDPNNLLIGLNEQGKKKNFEPPFSWYRLTMKLRVNNSVAPGTYNSIPNNCHIELGEECDYCPDTDSYIYKFNKDTCAKWLNNIKYSGSLSCSGQHVNTGSCLNS